MEIWEEPAAGQEDKAVASRVVQGSVAAAEAQMEAAAAAAATAAVEVDAKAAVLVEEKAVDGLVAEVAAVWTVIAVAVAEVEAGMVGGGMKTSSSRSSSRVSGEAVQIVSYAVAKP